MVKLVDKILNFVKIAISSRLLWFFLLVAYFICSLINYILMKYFYSLMIIDPKYLFFWKPHNYYFYSYDTSPYYQGPSPIFSFVFIVILFVVLYKTNTQKFISKRIGWRTYFFLLIYAVIIYPQLSNSPGPMTKIINNFPFSPIEKFMKDTKMNYITETVETPFGKFKMHKSSNSLPDLLYSRQLKCKVSEKQKLYKSCVSYPYKY